MGESHRSGAVDEDFKAKLLADPATVLNENGIDVPEGMTVRFVEAKGSEILDPFPTRPSGSEELSDEDLKKVAGGAKTILFDIPGDPKFPLEVVTLRRLFGV